jgi:hypothetical protein
MQSRTLVLAVLTGAIFVVGCNRAESPVGTPDEDLAAAREDATDDTVEPYEILAQNHPFSAVERTTESQYETSLAVADARHQQMMEACVTLAVGEQQQACKDRADSELAADRARAQSLRRQPTRTS